MPFIQKRQSMSFQILKTSLTSLHPKDIPRTAKSSGRPIPVEGIWWASGEKMSYPYSSCAYTGMNLVSLFAIVHFSIFVCYASYCQDQKMRKSYDEVSTHHWKNGTFLGNHPLSHGFSKHLMFKADKSPDTGRRGLSLEQQHVKVAWSQLQDREGAMAFQVPFQGKKDCSMSQARLEAVSHLLGWFFLVWGGLQVPLRKPKKGKTTREPWVCVFSHFKQQ